MFNVGENIGNWWIHLIFDLSLLVYRDIKVVEWKLLSIYICHWQSPFILENATADSVSEVNWAAVLEICDKAGQSTSGYCVILLIIIYCCVITYPLLSIVTIETNYAINKILNIHPVNYISIIWYWWHLWQPL